jgi:hypothetical protein
MNRRNCATPFEVVDGLELIRKERERLKGIVASKEFKRNKAWQWIPEWLEKTDEQHLQEGMTVICHICLESKRALIIASTEEDEYGFCKECAEKIGELAKEIPKEAQS